MGYTVLGTLGYGARSTIYAVHDKDARQFALKRVVRNNAQDQRYLDQAEAEYEIARRFTHPNLRRIYKLFRQRRLIRVTEIFVLMELVEGTTMEQYRTRDMLSLCRMFQQVAMALHEMHEGGYVHCDIKPNNIIVTADDMVKIIDFGQSCPIGTVKERIQGTPDYIAPEQVKRKQITPATDVFNLGATFYWMLTHRHVPTMIPKHPHRVGGVHLDNEEACPPPRDVNPHVPPALSSLVMNCIATDPLDRPHNMLQLHERLELALTQVDPKTPMPRLPLGDGATGKSSSSRRDGNSDPAAAI
jgi:serine/threonine-protein kinase